MAGKEKQKEVHSGSEFILISAMIVICLFIWYFTWHFLNNVQTIYSLIYLSLLFICSICAICFLVLVVSKLKQHEIENYYKLEMKKKE